MRVESFDPELIERLGGPSGVARHIRASLPSGASVAGVVSEIIAAVRDEGEAAVLRYTSELDTAGSPPRPLRVSTQDLDDAIKRLALDVVAGLQVTIANVAEVAQAGVGHDVTVGLPQGHTVTIRELPVPSAAVYVPGGRAPYPSTVAMGVVSARAAGVLEVAVCSPPGPSGEIDATILGACRLCGVDTVYRMGGAQAIAALALGTESVRRVEVIVGPGNLYVQEAKQQLSALVGIDGFAGPSDLIVLIGEALSAHEVRLAALDLLAQAEHGPASLVGAISSSEQSLMSLRRALEELAGDRPALDPGACVLLRAEDSRQALEIANELAPEHLELIGADMEMLAPRVRSAGCVFVGASAATAFGDYVAGSNHVLPTGGAARFASMLSPQHFRRRMAEVRIDENAASKLAAAGAPIARAEGFEVHALSMEARIRENQPS